MITIPYTYSTDEAATVQAFLSAPKSERKGEYWSRPEVDSLRSGAKTYYIRIQQRRCCYCNQLILSQNHRAWDLEHIVPRETNADFMFEPKNLAASCIECNSAKGAKQTLVNSSRRTYPTRSSDYKIVHPHFDNFADHIFWNGSFVYAPRSVKGKKTIYTCDLLRFVQENLVLPANPLDRRFEDSIEDLESLEPSRSERAANEISQVINRTRSADQS
jgi:hypothetical protein